MERIGIVGAGLVGRAWAVVFARAGHPVAMHDADPAALRAGLEAVDRMLADLAGAGLLADSAIAVRLRIRPATSLDDAVAGAEYVQESVHESAEAKRAVFAEMDARAAPACILASSTSTIPASEFASTLAGRARCLVAHPVNPPHLVPLVELCPSPWTDPGVLERARALQARAGQVPILVRREIRGFILNRMQAALLNEALSLFADGYASAEDIDRAVRDGLGLRWSFMGPFETIDLNAPGGVPDYAARYAPGILDQVSTQHPREWTADLVARLAAERRAALPASGLAARQAWRDRRLMALAAHRRGAADDDDHGHR